MLTEERQHPEIAYVTLCINEANEKLQIQQSKIEQAIRIGQSVYEEKGRLMIMVEALEMMTKRRAELIKST